MITKIDNSQRVFLVMVGLNTYVCNLCDMEAIVRGARKDLGIKTYHIWNQRMMVATKKMLKGMLEGSKLNSEFLKLVTK